MAVSMFGWGRGLTGAALIALSSPAFAADKPATPEGAKVLQDVFRTYFGAEPTIDLQGSAYHVSYLVTVPPAISGDADFKVDPLKIDLTMTAQDDGGWRVEQKDFPPFSFTHKIEKNGEDLKETAVYANFHQTMVWDPTLPGVRNSDFSADKILIAAELPQNGKEDLTFNGWKGTVVGSPGPDHTVSTLVKQSIDSFDLSMLINPKPKDGQPVTPVMLTGKIGPTSGDAKIDDLNTQAWLNVWSFMVAHPKRSDLEAAQADFKTQLAAAASGQPSVTESFEGQQISFSTMKGGVSFDKGRIGLSAAAKGPQSQFEEHLTFTGIALPDNVTPAIYKPFVPTSADIGVKLSGFDFNAAAAEAIADLKVVDDGPWLDNDGWSKVFTKLLGAGPLLIDLPLSHIVSSDLDLTIDGHAEYRADAKPFGKATLRAKNFDKTVAALRQLGPDVQSKLTPVVAMAKGLAKTDGDSLVWVCEIGPDRVMKVNGLSLGKAPL